MLVGKFAVKATCILQLYELGEKPDEIADDMNISIDDVNYILDNFELKNKIKGKVEA